MRFCFLVLIAFLLSCVSNQPKEENENVDVTIGLTAWVAPQKASYRGISVLDSQSVWISGSNGAIVRTLDGGSNWELIHPPDQDSMDFRDVHAFSKDHALISSAGYPARIYLTQDAGTSWELVYENLDSSAFLNSVHFKDSLNGLVLGDRLDGYHFVLTTANGGRTWTRIDSSKLPTPLEVEHGFAASGSCITTNSKGEFLLAYGGEQSRVFVGDPIKGWEAVDVPLGGKSASSGIYSIASFEDKLMVVGGDYTQPDSSSLSFISLDGGRNWENGGSLSGYRSAVDHSKQGNYWLAAGINGIEYSIDDGKNWIQLDGLNINTLQFDDASGIGYAAGPDGKQYGIQLKVMK